MVGYSITGDEAHLRYGGVSKKPVKLCHLHRSGHHITHRNTYFQPHSQAFTATKIQIVVLLPHGVF